MRRYRVAIVEPATVVAEGVASILSAIMYSPDAIRCGMCSIRAAYPIGTALRSVMKMSGIRVEETDVVIISTSLHHLISDTPELSQIPIIGLQTALTDSETLRVFNAVATIYTQPQELLGLIREANVATTIATNYRSVSAMC